MHLNPDSALSNKVEVAEPFVYYTCLCINAASGAKSLWLGFWQKGIWWNSQKEYWRTDSSSSSRPACGRVVKGCIFILLYVS